MMANRKLPFGYEMQRGIICVKAAEASIVREIYAAYIRGMSYRQIMDSLNAQTVPYSESSRSWNKNMVARILGNELYTGNASYPAILSAEEYRHAASAKPATGIPTDASGQVKTVRQLSRCAVCGGTLTLSANKHGWARWNCPSCGGISSDAVMPDTISALTHIVSAIRNDRNMVQAPPHQENHAQGLLDQSEKDFDSSIHTEAFDESTARAKALSLAAARFNALGSEDYETVRIRYILSTTEQSGGLDTVLLRQITSAILIHPHGEVSIKLKNGQIIKGSDRT